MDISLKEHQKISANVENFPIVKTSFGGISKKSPQTCYIFKGNGQTLKDFQPKTWNGAGTGGKWQKISAKQ